MAFYTADPYKQGHPKEHSMSPERLERLKAVLSISSHYGEEKEISNFIHQFCETHGFAHIVDTLGSVLITKGEVKEGEKYPLVGAHMDTVHAMTHKTIKEQDNVLTAWNDSYQQVGIGGDDLAGVAICLELLLIMPVLKVGLFVSEEVGCVGSRHAVKTNYDWFNDVGYMITQICSGVELFDRDGDFINKTLPLLQESMGEKMRFFNHPYTDVSVIKRTFPFSCINISAGYFNWHSSREYVVISEVEKAVVLGEKMINELGYQEYAFNPDNTYVYNSNKNTNLWD